jgi:putative DNA methylase
MVEAGILESKRGKVRLLKPAELPKNWDPQDDERLTVWEMVHQLVRSLEQSESQCSSQSLAKLGTA